MKVSFFTDNYPTMRHDIPVSSIMTDHVTAIEPHEKFNDVRHFFEKAGFHHLPVVEDGRLVGIVSYTDYLRVIQEQYHPEEGARKSAQQLLAFQVREMMTPNPVCLLPEDTLGTALRIFRENSFHALPVIDASKKLTGILTTHDVMKALEDVLAPDTTFEEEV